MQGRKITEDKLTILRALQQVLAAEAVSDIHHVIKRDVSLSYRLLKYINTASFGLRKNIASIEQALALLGLNHIRRWLSLLALASLGKHKTPELIKTALTRGYLLEHIAKQRREKETGDDFLLGMFSVLDARLDVSMNEALQGLSLPANVHQGLTNASSEMSKKLSMCKAVEHGDWEKVQQWAEHGNTMDITCISRIYLEAIVWSDTQVTHITAT